jgi:hypothetical protein
MSGVAVSIPGCLAHHGVLAQPRLPAGRMAGPALLFPIGWLKSRDPGKAAMAAKYPVVSVTDLFNAGLLRSGQELRFSGNSGAKAKITAQGTVLFNGTHYRTPSAAAQAVNGTSRNGWTAWRARTAENQWTTLSVLRTRLQETLER